jgi:hypothetical protein
MEERVLNEATNPFFTTRKTRKVGLGLSLLKQKAESTGGYFTLNSAPGAGTIVEVGFNYSHIDRPPNGDIWNVLYQIILSVENTEIVYKHFTEKGNFTISSSEIQESLGNVSLRNKEIRKAVTELIKNNIEAIQ